LPRKNPYVLFPARHRVGHQALAEVYWRAGRARGYLGVAVKLPWAIQREKARPSASPPVPPYRSVAKLNYRCRQGAGRRQARGRGPAAGHLAAALDARPCRCSTNPGLTGAYGKVQIHLASDFPCAPCLQKKCTYQPTAEDARRFDLKREWPLCFTRLNPERVASRLSTLLMAEELR
jgi:heptosyltransferase-1